MDYYRQHGSIRTSATWQVGTFAAGTLLPCSPSNSSDAPSAAADAPRAGSVGIGRSRLTHGQSAQCATTADTLDDPVFYKFRNAFNPKYDISRPTYKHWFSIGLSKGMPSQGASAILARKAFFIAYMELTTEMIQQIEQNEADINNGIDPEEFNWQKIWQSVKGTWPLILWSSMREWVTAGVHITYQRYVYDHCERRTMWKLLKQAPQSALRKLCRQGWACFARNCWVFLRGEALFYAADATVRSAALAWNLRRVLRNPNGKRAKHVAVACAKHLAVEVGCVLARWVIVAVASSALITITFYGTRTFRQSDAAPDTFKPDSNRAEKPLAWPFFISMAIAGLCGDFAHMTARTHLNAYLHVDDPDDDQGAPYAAVPPA